jgi:hypothetical protein
MKDQITNGVATTLEAMRAAVRDLAKGATYLSTADAVRCCPFELSEETLLTYPDFVVPRLVKNPRARRKTYLWDPRDIRALPTVLRRWQQAILAGPAAEREFQERRYHEVTERDLAALSGNGRKEAA